jgi:hypothetical protein
MNSEKSKMERYNLLIGMMAKKLEIKLMCPSLKVFSCIRSNILKLTFVVGLSICHLQTSAQNKASASEWYLNSLQGSDTIRYQLFTKYVANGLYDSLEIAVNKLFENNMISSKFYMFTRAELLEQRGFYDSARAIATRWLEYEDESGGDLPIVYFLEDHAFFKHLCMDSLLITSSINTDLERLRKKNLTCGIYAQKLAELYFEDRNLRFALEAIPDADTFRMKKFGQIDDSVQNEYVQLLQCQGMKFNEDEVGKTCYAHTRLVWHCPNYKVRREILLPLLKKAHTDGHISTRTLIGNILKLDVRSGYGEVDMKRFNESLAILCNLYSEDITKFTFMP